MAAVIEKRRPHHSASPSESGNTQPEIPVLITLSHVWPITSHGQPIVTAEYRTHGCVVLDQRVLDVEIARLPDSYLVAEKSYPGADETDRPVGFEDRDRHLGVRAFDRVIRI